MELVKLNDENSFDPTPKLKSSPVPIFFVSFNQDDVNCIYCGEEYTFTIMSPFQKYCKKCLSDYLTNITDNYIYLDVYLFTKDLECNEHEISRTKVPQNIQECCRNCLTILCFKQMPYTFYFCNNTNKNVFESEKYCKLCGKLIFQRIDSKSFNLCSDCYLVSSGYIESTLTKKLISIIYLPWWDNRPICYCKEKLIFAFDCQKYCEICFIFFIGCRYCLTTNIIFGITNQSQCKKCKRVSTIIFDITKISINSGNNVLDDFLDSTRSRFYQSEIAEFDKIKNYDFIEKTYHCYGRSPKPMRYIPYSQFTNVKEIAKGGFSIVYQATLLDHDSNKNGKIVILKRFKNSQYTKKYFLNEVKTLLIRISAILFDVYNNFFFNLEIYS
jgi:hypothetical protein